jgi:uncharacterized damage-inducible protein DinB
MTGATMLEQYRMLAGYNTWMNARVYDVASVLSDAERRQDRGAFFGSIQGTFNHLLLTDRAWLERFTGDPSLSASLDRDGRAIAIRGLDQELYADFDLLRSERTKTDAAIEAWIATLDEARLVAPIRYRTTAGVEHEHALWPALSHFFNHQTHHRGQMTTLLAQLGRDYGVTDLITYWRDHRRDGAAPG